MTYVRVALDVPLDRLFDYRCDDARDDAVGRLVVVPFGRGRKVGVVIAVSNRTDVADERIRPVLRVVRDLPALPAATLDLLRFCHRYYHHPLGATVANALPTALRRPDGTALGPRVGYRPAPDPEGVDRKVVPTRAVAQHALLTLIHARGVLPVAEVTASGPSAVRAARLLLKAGWIGQCAVAEPDEPVPGAATASMAAATPLNATPSQRLVVETVRATFGTFRCHLLHGVTGSGKTEVYLQLIEAALALGHQALLLVPEINLTPQLEAALEQRFGRERLVTLHSGVAEGERLQRWLRAVRGQAAIVAGTRLAIFTPLPRLGLVIVDEEHDGSYKQQEGLRYSARDAAVFLAKARSIPVLLGSATPSLESYAAARSGRYALLELPTRAASRPPLIRTISTHGVKLREGLAPAMIDALAGALERSEQSLVFINRRGFAPTLFCHECGWIAPCLRCSARLTFHARGERLRCHYCGHEEAVARSCPTCGNQDLRALGEGTQRIERALQERFPEARIARVDRDTTQRKQAFADLRREIGDNRVDILVGTQMLAKGHDFPRLTTVGVLGADLALLAADFRAEERSFALLLQVAGRAGRGTLPGQVLIQTAFPDHPLYRAVVAQDYAGFAAGQLALRSSSGFPPSLYQALLRAEASTETQVFGFLDNARRLAVPADPALTVYDPAAARVARVAGRWRGQLLVQSAARSTLHGFLDGWLPRLESNRVRWSIDVDPMEM